MQPARAALTVLLACAASGLGCGNPEERPWDGNYVPLEERGDWVDTGPLAPCRVLEDSGAACGALESFDLSACRRRTLSKLERQGVYRAELRYESKDSTTKAAPLARGGGFKLRMDGTPELVMGTTQVKGRWDAQTLFLSGRSDDGSTVYSFAGCTAPQPRKLTGCFSVCRDGQLAEFATFSAERMARFEGEGYASGALQRLSEAPVETGTPVDVHVAGGHAYVVSQRRGAQPGGLTVFDVSEPLSPMPVGQLRLSGDSDWRSVTSANGTLYVASAATGVLVFDITNPADPVFVRSLPGEPLHVSNVRTDDTRLYATVVSPQPGTLVFDISTPAAPRLLHQVSQGSYAPRPLSGRSAVSYDGLLYVNHRHEGFKVIDVSDTENLRLLGTYTYPYGNSHSSAVGTFAGRTVAFETGQGVGARLRVLDVSNPARIVKMAEHGMRHAVYPGSVELRGTRLYLAWYQEGVRVLDVSNPTQPRQVAHYNTFRETDPGRGDGPEEGASGIHVPGDGYVYVVDTSRGLLILTEPP